MINVPNAILLLYELFLIICRRKLIIKFKGRQSLFIVLPCLVAWNFYKLNDLYLDTLYLKKL